MAKKLKFDHVDDAELRAKLEQVVAGHNPDLPDEVLQFPRYVFSRATPGREIGAICRVRNGLDEDPRGGTILEQVGRAWRVSIDNGHVIIVHDPDDSWGY